MWTRAILAGDILPGSWALMPRGVRWWGAKAAPTPADGSVVLRRTGTGEQILRRIAGAAFHHSSAVALAYLCTLEGELDVRRRRLRAGEALHLAVPAADRSGFDIALTCDARRIDGDFGGLAQEFASSSEAFAWVRRALNPAFGLRTILRGGRPCEWRIERCDGRHGHREWLAAGHAPTLVGRLAAPRSVWRRNAALAGAV